MGKVSFKIRLFLKNVLFPPHPLQNSIIINYHLGNVYIQKLSFQLHN